ncbi:MAG: trypsin-like serine protease [Nannocystales bacterium]
MARSNALIPLRQLLAAALLSTFACDSVDDAADPVLELSQPSRSAPRARTTGSLELPDPPAPHVFGGAEAELCQWPTTVAVLDEASLCTGTLVHPQVVTYAAHCGSVGKTIAFGENLSDGPMRTTQRCVANPQWTGAADQGQDWAFCVLDEPILDLPFSPPAYGCEIELIQPEQGVVIAGFGDDDFGVAGTKRWGATSIMATASDTVQIGGQGTGVANCLGDSGGTAYLPMPDGSFRSISIGSTSPSPVCSDVTTTHALLHAAVPWIEENSGIDITPCHDADGSWNPTPSCSGFFGGGKTASGTWENMCEGTLASGRGALCGPAFDAQPDDQPPAVVVVDPMQGAELESGTTFDIDIEAVDAGQGVGEVWIEINGQEQPARDTLPPFGFANVSLPDGVYTFVAHATDWAGNEGVSEPVTIGVNAQVPDPPDASSGGGSSGQETEDAPGAETGGDSPSDSGGSSGPASSDGGGGGGCHVETAGPSGFVLLGLFGLFARRRRS